MSGANVHQLENEKYLLCNKMDQILVPVTTTTDVKPIR